MIVTSDGKTYETEMDFQLERPMETNPEKIEGDPFATTDMTGKPKFKTPSRQDSSKSMKQDVEQERRKQDDSIEQLLRQDYITPPGQEIVDPQGLGRPVYVTGDKFWDKPMKPQPGGQNPHNSPDIKTIRLPELPGGWPGLGAPSIQPGRPEYSSLEDSNIRTESIFSPVLNWLGLGESTSTKSVSGKPDKPEYPTDEDAKKAIEAGIGYATPYEDYINNETARVLGTRRPTGDRAEMVVEGGKITSIDKADRFVPQTLVGGTTSDFVDENLFNKNPPKAVSSFDTETKVRIHNLFARAALAVGRDPLATLGFDPKNVLIDVLAANIAPGYKENINYAGVTSLGTGKIYTNLYHDPSSTVHESIHNGLLKLENGLYPGDEETPKRFRDIISQYEKESGRKYGKNEDELMVRHIIRTIMGLDEAPLESATLSKKQIAESKTLFEDPGSRPHQKLLKSLQDLATEVIAKKRPGGPR